MEEEKQKKIGFLGILFLIWFIGSIAAMVVFSEINELYCVIAFGQVFFVIGVISVISLIKDKTFSITNPISLLLLGCLLVGFFTIFIPILYINPNFFGIYINPNSIYPKIFLYIPLYAGFLLSTIYYSEVKHYNSDKLVRISAVISELKENSSSTPRSYYPIIKYSFNDLEYSYELTDFTVSKKVKIGDPFEIKIDPENPKKVNYKNKWDILILIFGILLVVGAAIAIFLF